jgi:PKD repeat protein
MRKILFLLVLGFISLSISAQNISELKSQAVNSIFQDKSEIIFKFNVTDKAQINNDLTRIISIDNVKTLPDGSGYEVRAYANKQEFQNFLSRNIPYTLVPKSSPKALTMATTPAGMANWDAYPTYSVYEQMMANFASTYPNICNIDTIMSPTPSGNYRILVARISDNVNTAENEPQFLYTSSMHGDETTGFILTLRLINYLLTNYGTNAKVTNLVNNCEIWINPLANPEGTYYNYNPAGSNIANSQRGNLNGTDMNRNYLDPKVGPNPDGLSYAPETQAFMNFAATHHFNMSANFHGGAEVTNYPWDDWTTAQNPNADAAWWERVLTAYVDSTRLVTPSYMSDVTPDGVTEGAEWYSITGGRQDYMNWFQHCREVTIELDGDKTTQTQNLNLKWNENYHSLLNYIQESLYGVRGIITDSCSGLPIRAKVWVNSYDQVNDSSQVYSALPIGNYHKYMIAGTYSITYSAPGYTSKTITGVALANGAATVRNIQLAPAAAPDAQFTGNQINSCSATVQFTNTSAASTNFTWYFGDGTTSTDLNPSHTYTSNGTYTVKLYANNCKGIDSLVRLNYITINIVAVPNVTDGANCGAGSVNLSANASGTINWYDAQTGGNLVNTGTSYTTPTLNTTTIYYVENSTIPPSEYVGKTDSVGGGAMYTNNTYYLKFDCYTPVVLKSVKVYAGAAGSRTIAMRNSSGTTIQSATVNIPTGESRVTLNFNVPVGTAMQLAITSASPNLFRSTGGISYPYTLPGKISITGNSSTTTSRYYFFYDWEIQSPGCVTARVPVTASILSTPVADFSNSVVSNNVNFTNSSTGATTYHWDFGDSGTSTLSDPSHTYAATGTYTVTLISFNSICSDTITHDVTITTVGGVDDNSFSGVTISPNPSKDYVTISFGSEIRKPFTLSVYTLAGKLVSENNYSGSLQPVVVNLSACSEGIYNLMLRNDSEQMHFKVTKIK